MPKFTEEQLNNFRYPPSETEEQKLLNSEYQVKQAIKVSEKLRAKSINIFGQGSYANDTNVKNNSDIDINVRLDSSVFVQLPKGKKDEDYGYSTSSYDYVDFRKDVKQALIDYFGEDYIKDSNKCITVLPNSNRVEIDVVPTYKFDRYDSETHKIEGVRFISKDGDIITNFPLQHIENGINKNARTQKRFKRLTRIYRRIRYNMIKDEILISENITSFLLECLVWNVPDRIFNDYSTWSDRLKQSIIFLYNETVDEKKCQEWGEVSELLYLFKYRKWTVKDVNDYLIKMWNYLEF
ncbi:nucleotidyltransferase [Elizabethkingia sp. M8]|uniref:nucleotidyltransferase domain-containing protein n=1 Tax=Elizabethkingia sp. M8 TaxID=2796140 RepID=UPI0019030631|nr:nucleotidyltransferase [Elizabethkingia sp. M8]QQM25336.1 nucleotidyltransferase [Elizabethkingia sp. M8]